MEVVNKKENQIMFKLEMNESLANAIRRYVNQIPVLAIDEVEILKNGSALYDETVAHRIGLVVLKTEKSMNSKTKVKFKLSVKKEGIVYAGELKGDTKVVYEKTPITSLNKTQELEISATAKLGIGAEHSKFSPGLIFYRNIIELSIDKDCLKDVTEVCPQKILEVEGGKVIVTDSDKCDMCEACTDFCRKKGKNSIKLKPTKELVMTIETFGHLTIDEILKNSIEILKKDLAEVVKKIGK